MLTRAPNLAALLAAAAATAPRASAGSALRGLAAATAGPAINFTSCAAPAPGWAHGHYSKTQLHPCYPDFTLWLVEEFDTPLDLDSDPIWTWSDGGLAEGQVRFEKEAIKFENGRMIIEASENDGTGSQPQSCSHAESGHVSPKKLRSGEIRTRHNMFRYGIYEVRMRVPKVQPGNPDIDGNFISTMFAFRDAKFRHWREIDVEITGNSKSSISMNVLNAENTDEWKPEIQSARVWEARGSNLREEFHNYAFKWTPDGISWYFDGQKVSGHPAHGGLPVPDMSTKIMMNLWVFRHTYAFGGLEGKNNRYPMRSEYEWFRFYKWNYDDRYPCADGSTSCLTAEDWYLSGNNPCDGVQQTGTRNGKTPCAASTWSCRNGAHMAAAEGAFKNGTLASGEDQVFFP